MYINTKTNMKVKRQIEKESIFENFTKKEVILCGNSINQLENNDADWGELLKKIIKSENLKVQVNDQKSYPLIFEEILFSCSGEYKIILKRLKEKIVKHISTFQSTIYHEKLLQLPISEVLTTNYDYGFERCFEEKFSGFDRGILGNEYRYSLHRQHTVHDKKIWHIHGELNNGFRGEVRYPEQSIMIGNEHYGDYQRAVHEYIKPSGGLKTALINIKDSWVKRFFTHEMHIVGFGLDYTENHLWWLLNFRARKYKEHNELPNSIKFYYPNFSKDSYQYKKQLLKALKVEIVEIPVNVPNNKWNDRFHLFWDKFLTEYF